MLSHLIFCIYFLFRCLISQTVGYTAQKTSYYSRHTCNSLHLSFKVVPVQQTFLVSPLALNQCLLETILNCTNLQSQLLQYGSCARNLVRTVQEFLMPKWRHPSMKKAVLINDQYHHYMIVKYIRHFQLIDCLK